SPCRMFRFQLGVMISPFRNFRLVERQTVSNQPIAEVGTIDGTRCNRGSAAILIDGRACNGTICDERLELMRRLYPALILDFIGPSAKLAAFRRVDAKQMDADALNSERVAVDDAGLSRDAVGECRRRGEQCSEPQREHQPHRHSLPAKVHRSLLSPTLPSFSPVARPSAVGHDPKRFLYLARRREVAKNRHRPGRSANRMPDTTNSQDIGG